MRDITVRKVTLKEADRVDDLTGQSPGQLIGVMWRLALDAWSFKEKLGAEPRLQRHVVVLKRSER
jgi:hypothetical protein